MTDIKVVKRYEYRGHNIAIRTLGPDVIEYLFAHKGSIYTQSFDRTSKARNKFKIKEVGAATIIVCNAAEQVVDLVIKKKSAWYNLLKRLGLVKVEDAKQTKINEETTQESASQGPRPDSRNEGPSQIAEQNRQAGAR